MDRRGRVIGMTVFVLGIVVLICVLAIAYSMFAAPAEELFAVQGDSSLTAAGLGNAIALVFVRIGLLFVMTLAGSLIAGRGIQLYLGSAEDSHAGARTDR